MLNIHRSRLPVSRVLGVCAALALVAIILPVAGVMAGSQAATSRFSGTVMDTVGRAMPDLRLVLTSAGDKSTRDASSDDAGDSSSATSCRVSTSSASSEPGLRRFRDVSRWRAARTWSKTLRSRSDRSWRRSS